MAARTTRREARDRVIKAFMSSLDKVIPPDEAVPLRGGTFREWEDQASELRRAVIPTLLEERAALEGNALVLAGEGGRCPHCESGNVYLERQETSPEVLGPDGPVSLPRQHCRCRDCGGSFSPSGAGLGAAGGGAADAGGGGAVGAGGGGEGVRPRRPRAGL
jgi:hypothetical protein